MRALRHLSLTRETHAAFAVALLTRQFDREGSGEQNSAVTHGSRRVKRTMETDPMYLCEHCGIQNQSGIVCYMCGWNKVLKVMSPGGGAQGP